MVSSPPKPLLQLLHGSYSTIQCFPIQSQMLNVKPVSLDPVIDSIAYISYSKRFYPKI